MFESIFLSL